MLCRINQHIFLILNYILNWIKYQKSNFIYIKVTLYRKLLVIYKNKKMLNLNIFYISSSKLQLENLQNIINLCCNHVILYINIVEICNN